MSSQKRIGTKLTMLGMVVAFLYSALALPVAGSDLQKTQNSHLSLTQTGDHSTPSVPIPLPEEKEEENRGEKDSKFAISFLISSVQVSKNLRIELTKNRLQYSLLVPASDTPLYILKHSFLI